MCGIAGAWGHADIKKMTNLLQHRGPDDEGYYSSSHIHFGVKRLGIIDLENGHQPMFNKDKSVVCIFNGEIFNYLSLKKELIHFGHHFSTKSDTEVLVHAYEQWGISCVDHFNGMFAFAIWDNHQKKLFLARDRFGEKPLYYALDQNRLLFASEIKSIHAVYKTSPHITQDFLCFETSCYENTLFKNIYSLLPGHYLIFDGKKLVKKQYWKFKINSGNDKLKLNDYIEELRYLIKDSIHLRQQSDVPIGIFVSGGLDSSIIASLSHSSHYFSCNYTSYGTAYDESSYTKELLKRPQPNDIHFIEPDENAFIENIHRMIYHLDQPIATASSLSEFLLAKKASKYVKVILNGQGADEIFGGYIRYILMLHKKNFPEFQDYLPLLQYLLRSKNSSSSRQYFHLLKRGKAGKCFNTYIQPFFKNPESLLNNMLNCDIHLSLPSLLTMNDRASSAYGLENRSPFLDHRIAEFVFSLPEKLKINGHTTKYILREAAKGWIPETIRTRKDKKGLITPVNLWLNGKIKKWTDSTLLSLSKRNLNLSPLKNNRGEFDRSTYHLVCLELWFQKFFPDFFK